MELYLQVKLHSFYNKIERSLIIIDESSYADHCSITFTVTFHELTIPSIHDRKPSRRRSPTSGHVEYERHVSYRVASDLYRCIIIIIRTIRTAVTVSATVPSIRSAVK